MMNATAGPRRISVPSQLQVRFTDENLRTLLEEFCNRTKLSAPEACRQLMWMGLRDGIEKAAARLIAPEPFASGSVNIPHDRLLELLEEAFRLSGYKITPVRKGAAGNKRKRK